MTRRRRLGRRARSGCCSASAARAASERAAAVAAFTRVATVTLVVVLATGLARASSRCGSLSALVDTSYGITLLVKVAWSSGLVALGALNHFFWVPALQDGSERRRPPLRAELARRARAWRWACWRRRPCSAGWRPAIVRGRLRRGADGVRRHR